MLLEIRRESHNKDGKDLLHLRAYPSTFVVGSAGTLWGAKMSSARTYPRRDGSTYAGRP